MKRRTSITSRTLALIFSLILALSVLVPMAASANPAEVTINILHTNDVHGRFYQVDGNNAGMMGIDKIAAIKSNTPNAILVDAGDAIHGLPIVNMNQGLNAIELMVAAGYDVMTPGNHDFNYGSLRLMELAGIAAAGGLDIISSNVIDKATGQTFLPSTKIVEIEGINVGFFGLTTLDAVILPSHIENVEFSAYKENAELAIAELREGGADVIIALAHFSCVEIHDLISELADKPDVVIEGHDHHLGDKTHEGVLIAGAGQHQENLGNVEITINSDREIISKNASLISKEQADAIEGDAVVKAMAETIKAEVIEEYSEVVASSEVFLSSFRGDDLGSLGVRNSEQALGNLIADALKVTSNADIAVTNGGGLRADIRNGELTKGAINAVLPFGNTAVLLTATPSDLYEIMETGLQSLPLNNGRFPQISGMVVEYDPDAPAFSKVLSISINGQELDRSDDTTEFCLATNNFMADGGDGYLVMAELGTIAELGSLDDALIEYIVDVLGGVITAGDAKIDCRILNIRYGSLGHLPGEREVVVEPTLTSGGVWEVKCEHCGLVLDSGEISSLKLAGVTVTTKDFISITETAKNSRVWALRFSATLALETDSGELMGFETVEYTIFLNGNNANLDGSFKFNDDHDLAGFTLTYDIKGNGSNIKVLSLG